MINYHKVKSVAQFIIYDHDIKTKDSQEETRNYHLSNNNEVSVFGF